ncbi:unnamed protein product [Clavelina lepadiformis]|uniref:Sulfotransferase n=1 Tax=Clavelina lepadiformis TaxID=159417 RepID=A0ABP0GSF8_CLALP
MVTWSAKPYTHAEAKMSMDLRKKLEERERIKKNFFDYKQSNKEKEIKRLPDIIGIGVKKCGTGSLLEFLLLNPAVRPPNQGKRETIVGETFFFNKKFDLGIGYYKNLFPYVNDREKIIEKTPSYFMYPPSELPERIYNILPEAKLLLMVCDPTPRVFSDYIHQTIRYQLHNDKSLAKYETFEEYIDHYLPKMKNLTKSWLTSSTMDSDQELEKMLSSFMITDRAALLLSTGLYFFHIQRWLRIYNASNLMIIDGEEFLRSPGPVLEKIQEFIGVPKLVLHEEFMKNPETNFFCYRPLSESQLNNNVETIFDDFRCPGENKGRTRNGAKPMPEAISLQLRNFYRPFNKAFFKKIGCDFGWQ